MQVFGDYLYIFGSNIGAGGAVMCSLNDPWNPVYVGLYDDNYVHDGYVLNDTLYSAEIYAGQFSVVDVTNKANPAVLAIQPTPGAFNHNTWFSDNNQFLYTTDELNNTPVGVFDVTDLQDIKLVETYFNDSLPNEEVHNVRVINDFLICPSYGSQLTIVDGARPDNLIEIARHATGGFLCWDASPYLPSGNIIATDMDGIFYVFAPYYVRACYLEGNVTDLITGLPIDGAQAKILTTNANTASNLVGDYKTGNATAGTFDVEFSKAGYVTKVVPGVVLTNGNLTTLNVQLEPFSLILEVKDAVSGLPVPSAKVKLQNATTNADFTTNASGQIALSTITTGNYDITAAKWGYKSTCMSATLGATGNLTMLVDPAIYDDFTFDFGWTTSGNATSGAWVAGEPIGTLFGTTQANPDFDVTTDCSDRCFVTGNGGGSANNDDVDNGETILTSPTFDLTGYSNPYINYSSWFYEEFSSPAADDTLFIYMNNGTSTQLIDFVTGPSANNSTWQDASYRILDFITLTSTMNVIVSISDKPGTGNPLEAGFDRFEITEGPVSTAELSNAKMDFVVYPNPFSSSFEISFNNLNISSDNHIEITDISGRVVEKIEITSALKQSVSTKNLDKGVYFVNINDGNKILSVQKVIKL